MLIWVKTPEFLKIFTFYLYYRKMILEDLFFLLAVLKIIFLQPKFPKTGALF